MKSLPDLDDVRVGVVGLGYVGLPLAVAFARHFPTVGFDIDESRIDALRLGKDATLEVAEADLRASALRLTTARADLADCNVFIVTVPTPIDAAKRPDLRPLFAASATVGAQLNAGTVVIYESTVYPGATEEDCAPILERESGLTLNRDFFVGYSPERINPGDKAHTIETIVKVTSGSTPDAAAFVDAIYRRVVAAGTYRAQSIRVAEAAKVIENTQRDVNIALINELATLFGRLGIDTLSVLEAAATKWNFLPFRPGLVGGHCIGVDPYYLTHKAESVGHHAEVILAGRRINDQMGQYVATRLVKAMMQRLGDVRGRKALILGLTFKEDCPDVRNTGVKNVIDELRDYSIAVDVHDPWADPQAAMKLGVDLIELPDISDYDAVVIAVAHAAFRNFEANRFRQLMHGDGILFDVKGVLPLSAADLRL